MADNVHPVVELLAARMESHPEEFKFHAGGGLAVTGRWETWINQLGWYLSEAEKELIYGKAKELIFQRVHEEVLDELLNGEERRAQEKRERDLEMQRMIAQSQQRASQQASHLYGQAALQSGQLGNASGYPYYDSVTDTYEFGNGMKMTKAQAESDPGLLVKMKKALGL